MTWLANGMNSVGGRRMVAMAYWSFFASWGFSISDKSGMETLSSPQVVSFPLPGCFVLKAWTSFHFVTSPRNPYFNSSSPCRSAPSTGRSFPWHPARVSCVGGLGAECNEFGGWVGSFGKIALNSQGGWFINKQKQWDSMYEHWRCI